MGFLKRLFRSRAAIQQLPAGSITVDRDGHIVSSTVPSGYPPQMLRDIGRDVLAIFSEGRASQIQLAEITLQFASLRVTARELRGGAIIFLFPQIAMSTTSSSL